MRTNWPLLIVIVGIGAWFLGSVLWLVWGVLLAARLWG